MIKRFNIKPLLLAFMLLPCQLYSFAGDIPAGLPGVFGFGAIDKADSYGPYPPHFWKNGQGTTCWDYSYQYLVPGWTTWQANGGWARQELEYWEARGQIQVFTFYYTPYQRTNYQNNTWMTNYFNDFKLLMQIINQYSTKRVIVHLEPDLLGFWRNDGRTPTQTGVVAVGSSNFNEVCDGVNIANLPNTIRGWSEALFRIRNQYARNKVHLAHHYTHWATGTDLFTISHSEAEANTYTDNMTNYILQIEDGKNYDLFFLDPSDRDADWFYIKQGTGNRWTASDRAYTNNRSWGKIAHVTNRISDNLNRRGMFWQIPVGNTYFRTCNNTDFHYRDNHAQEFIPSTSNNGSSGTPGDAYSSSSTATGPGYWAQRGIIGVLFGPGGYDANAGSFHTVTHLRDYETDGITNPASNTNGAPGFNTWGQATSTVSDNEGGYVRAAVARYCSVGKYVLPGGSVPATATRTNTIGPSPTRTPTFTITPTFSATPFVYAEIIYDGDTPGARLSDGTVANGGSGTLTETTGGNPGNAMRLNYVSPAFWQEHRWTLTTPKNTGAHTHLRFDVRAETGSIASFIIVMNWTTGQKNISDYLPGGVTSSWQTVTIPLADLIPANIINFISFVSGDNTNSVIRVDNIAIIGAPAVTMTHTPPPSTATFTRTRTGTPTFTRTSTPVPPTPTFTRTRTGTPTFTRTSTPMPPTSTFTRTRTGTPTFTRTQTPPPATATFTRTRTGTPTFTRTSTPVPHTSTFTQTRTGTPTFTRTGTRTQTPSITVTSTPAPPDSIPTFTQTNTPVLTATPSFTATVTYTEVITATPTNTVEASMCPCPGIFGKNTIGANPIPVDAYFNSSFYTLVEDATAESIAVYF
ncbi:MAG TPA: hypothetical protein ENN43_06510, partial [bacterium]|nr:hypothetical protein [bacterium]